MKVSVTIEVTDVDRLIIGAATYDEFIPATRDEVKQAIVTAYENSMDYPRDEYHRVAADTVAAIRKGLNLS